MENTNQTKRFMELYKKFEVLLREANQTILNYEDSLSQNERDKLRICRQIRNYIFHHDEAENFITCSEAMCQFIANLIKKESDDSHHKRILTLKPICIEDRLSDIKIYFSKSNRNWLPVVDNNGRCLGSIELFQFLHIYARQNPNKKLTSVTDSSTFTNSTVSVLYENSSDIDNFEGSDALVIGDAQEYIGILKY